MPRLPGLENRLERQLPPVVLKVLGAVVVHVEDIHRVPEVGVPGDWKVHSQRQGLLTFARLPWSAQIVRSIRAMMARFGSTWPPPTEPR